MVFWCSSSCRGFDAKYSFGGLPPLVVVSDVILFRNWSKLLFWRPASSRGGFFFNSTWQKMPHSLLVAPLLLWRFVASLLKTHAKFYDGGRRFLLSYNVYWKTDAKYSSGGPPPLAVVSPWTRNENWCQTLFRLPSSSCDGFLFNSYWKLMRNAFLVALFPLWWILTENWC